MTNDDINKIILSLEDILKNQFKEGYTFKTKKGVEEIGNHLYFYGLLKRGNISLKVELDSRGHYQLTRLNSYTHAEAVVYESRDMFCEKDVTLAIAFEFPMPDNF